MQKITLKALAEKFDLELAGDPDHVITSLATLSAAGPQDLAFLANPAYARELPECRAGAIVLDENMRERWHGHALVSADPYVSWAKIAVFLLSQPRPHAGLNLGTVYAD